jgi:hypothetical protein
MKNIASGFFVAIALCVIALACNNSPPDSTVAAKDTNAAKIDSAN